MVDYSWVPWFRELALNVANGGRELLAESARRVDWLRDDPPLLRYGDDNVDPFSFFYTLSSQRKEAEWLQRLSNAGAVFAVESPLPERIPIMPLPTPRNTLFHSNGTGNPDLLWRLFLAAVADRPTVDGALFNGALRIKNVAIPKLTLALHLVNPMHFISVDGTAQGALGDTSATLLPEFETPSNYEEYRACRTALLSLFPGCSPYEVDTFLYVQEKALISSRSKYFQVSTNVDGNDSKDYWSEFDKQSAVWTGYAGTDRRPYPLNQPKRGDIMLVRRGSSGGRGIGIVEANGYSGSWNEGARISIYWINKRPAALADGIQTTHDGFGAAKESSQTYRAFAESDDYRETLNLIRTLARRGEVAEEVERTPESRTNAQQPLNQILFGPPGTGKTYETISATLEIVGNPPEDRAEAKARFDELREGKQVEFVTFHQSYAYEDFIEGIRPKLKGDELRYELRDGIFKRIAKRASRKRDKRFVLIIDEINRGNVAKIFGELITLIEPSKRKGGEDEAEATLPYSQKPFSVPNNLYLIGTMNTADRGIALLDTALRRRFKFVERMPDTTHLAKTVEGVDRRMLLQSINERIVEFLDRDHQIGHTYLMGVDTLEGLADAFRDQIVPLLQEYFYDDWEKLRRVLNDNGFIESRKGEIVPDKEVFEVLAADDERWQQAASYRAIYGGNGGGADST